MKSWIIITIPIVIITLLIPVFYVQLALLILFGFVLAFATSVDKVFRKALLAQAVLSLILYFFYQQENNFMGDVIAAVGLPTIILPVVFVVINALTTAFSVQIGISVKKIIK